MGDPLALELVVNGSRKPVLLAHLVSFFGCKIAKQCDQDFSDYSNCGVVPVSNRLGLDQRIKGRLSFCVVQDAISPDHRKPRPLRRDTLFIVRPMRYKVWPSRRDIRAGAAVSSLWRAAVYVLLMIWSFICLLPIYWLSITSIKGAADIDRPPGYLPFVDFSPSLDAWRFIFFEHNENLLTRLVHSGLISVAATALTIGCSSLAIYGLTRCHLTLRWTALVAITLPIGIVLGGVMVTSRLSFAAVATIAAIGVVLAIRMRKTGPVVSAAGAVAVLLATRILPPVVLALPLYVFGQALGVRDTLGFLTLVYTAINLPVAVWLMLPILGPRACEQEEAAQIDGASHLAILFTILLPMVRPGVIAVGLIVFLLSWNEYLFAAYLTFDHALTLPPWAVGQLSMKEAQVGGGPEEVAHLAAASILMILPALGFAAFSLKSFGRAIRER